MTHLLVCVGLLRSTSSSSSPPWDPAWPTASGPSYSGTSLVSPGPGTSPTAAYLRSPNPFGVPGTTLVGGTSAAPTLYSATTPLGSPGSIVNALTPWAPGAPSSGGNFTTTLSPVPVNATLIVLARPAFPSSPSSPAADTLVSFVTGPTNWTLAAFDGATGEPLWSVTESAPGGEPGAALAVTRDGARVLLLTTGGGGTAPRLLSIDAASGAQGAPLAPGALSFGGATCWALVPSADGVSVFASSETAVTRWELDAPDPGNAVVWSAPHGLPPTARPQAAAALIELAGGETVAVAGAGGVVALRSDTGARLWSWTPGDDVVALMAVPPAAATTTGSPGVLVALHNGGFWTTDTLTAINASDGTELSSVSNDNCYSLGASAAAIGGAAAAGGGGGAAEGNTTAYDFAVYTISVCWSPPAPDGEAKTPPPLNVSGGDGNGYPVYLLVDGLDSSTGALARTGQAFLSGGDYAGTLAQGVPVGPGARAWWAYAGGPLFELSGA